MILRRFELRLLEELGYGLTLAHEADSDAPIDPGADYYYVVEHGPRRVSNGAPHHAPDVARISGRTLVALANAEFTEASTLAQPSNSCGA